MKPLCPSHRTSKLCSFTLCPHDSIATVFLLVIGAFLIFQYLLASLLKSDYAQRKQMHTPLMQVEINLNQKSLILFHRGNYSWSKSMFLCLLFNLWMSLKN